jgi:hypothetical protein
MNLSPLNGAVLNGAVATAPAAAARRPLKILAANAKPATAAAKPRAAVDPARTRDAST